MLPYSQNRTFYNQPIFLSKEQKINPYGVLVRFFQDYQLIDLRAHLSEVSKTCLISDDPRFDDGLKRSDLMYCQQQIEMLLEAAFLVAQLNQDKDPDME